MKLLVYQGPIKEIIESFKNGCRITASTTKSGSVRNPFEQADCNAIIQPHLLQECHGCLHAEILGSSRDPRIVTGECYLLAAPVSNLDLIGKHNGRHEGLQFMETVGTFPEDAERKVDLGRCGECYGMMTTAHPLIV